ncbi:MULTISPECIES: FtsX-like permease family protein [Ferrimonas]|uniref:ABC transporter permease n=1 Tax=Ferrimonas TaxID=44011 RepID=UPI0003FC8061|nr:MULTISPECIES: FtsX-like permease family protein [Ferrimonas]USD38948.1 ABC transporter permease [Ferrimonas sp. SCSIO 43195]
MGQLTAPLFPYSFKLAALNLLRNGRRSSLAVIIIAIAVFALTSAGGFGLFTYRALQEATARDSGHLTLSQPGYFEQDEEMPLSNGIDNSQALIQALSDNPEIKAIQPRIYFTGLISNGTTSTIFMGIGVTAREFELKGPFLDIRQGHALTAIDSPRYDADAPQVMLGQQLASSLRVEPGDWITLLSTTSEGALNALDFQVHGIYSTGVPDLDKRQLYLQLNSAAELLASDRISTLSLFLHHTDATESVRHQVQQSLAEQQRTLEVTPWQERAFFYRGVKNLYDRIFGIMGLVMALVVFASLFNTLTMSVSERTREIGTLAAMGTLPMEIVNGFVREAGLLALLGSIAGALATALVSVFLLLVEVQMPPPPGRSNGYPLHIQFSWELVLMATVGVTLICLLAAFLAARKGVRTPITEALTHV